MIATCIKELLFEQDCVVIPDFGGFVANYVSADIHPIRHNFTPPSKRIAFNEMLRLNDGLLASYVAQQCHITREEALGRIREFTQQMREELRQHNRYRLPEVGTLSLNHEQRLQFEPDNRVNFLNDSFGLPELLAQPVDRSGATGKRTQAKPTDRTAMPRETPPDEQEDQLAFADDERARPTPRTWLFVGTPLVFLLFAAAGFFLFADDGNNALSSFNPFTALFTRNERPVADSSASIAPTTAPANKTDELAPEPIGDAAPARPQPLEAVSAAPKAVSPTKVTSTAAPRYYVILGSFARRRNADKLRRVLLARDKADAKIIAPLPGEGRYRVSYADFGTVEEAAERLQTLKTEFGDQVWVLRFAR